MMTGVLSFAVPCDHTFPAITLTPVPADRVMSQQFSMSLFPGFSDDVFEVVKVSRSFSVVSTFYSSICLVVCSYAIQSFILRALQNRYLEFIVKSTYYFVYCYKEITICLYIVYDYNMRLFVLNVF